MNPPNRNYVLPVAVALSLVCVIGVGLGIAVALQPSRSAGIYRDKVYHYTFKIPKGWQPPSQGKIGTTTDGVEGYVVHFLQPPGFRIVVRAPIAGLSKVPNKEQNHSENPGCPARCIFRRTAVDGQLAIFIQVTDSKGRLVGVYLDTNTAKLGYEFELISATPISGTTFRQFKEVIASFHSG